MLIIFSGLPGTGKTTLARELALAIGAVFLRIDSIEAEMRGSFAGDMRDAGYRVAYAVAEDNLRIGRTVVTDSMNPITVTREAWRAVAERAGVAAVEVEVRCSDTGEHRRRIEERGSPSWQAVREREYHAWNRPVIAVDTAGRPIADCVAELREKIGL